MKNIRENENIKSKIITGDVLLEQQKEAIEGSKINKLKIINNQVDSPIFCKDKIIIHGYEIENPLVYIGSNRKLRIAIDKEQPVSTDSRYINYCFISADYDEYSNYERHIYLQWLSSGKKSVANEKILTLYFRNLQERAVVEKEDCDLILFEIVRIYKRYSKQIGHHFADNYLNLFNYLIFTNKKKFNSEEEKILVNFINEYKSEDYIYDFYEELLFKICNKPETFKVNSPIEDIQMLFKNGNINEKIDYIFNYIIQKDMYTSKSKFYKTFNPKMLFKTFKNKDLFYTIFRILMYDNSNLINQQNLQTEIKAKRKLYKNYYFYYYDDEYYYNIKDEIILNIGMPIKKIFYQTVETMEAYEYELENIYYSGKFLEDINRYNILPKLLKDYFCGLLEANIALPYVESNILNRKILQTDFYRTTFFGLQENNIITIGDLIEKTDKEILQIKNIGKATLDIIKLYLKDFGFYLKPNSSVKKKTNIIPINIEFSINKDKLSQITKDTADVKCVLSEVFIEEEEIILTQNEAIISKKQELITTCSCEIIDTKYIEFINFIRTKISWTKKELNDYCRNNKIMLNNAISIVNDYYDEKYGEYFIEENDNEFNINSNIIEK